MSTEKEKKFRINIHLPEELNEISQLFQETVNRKSLIGQFLVNLLVYLKNSSSKEDLERFVREVARGNKKILETIFSYHKNGEELLEENPATEEVRIENFLL